MKSLHSELYCALVGDGVEGPSTALYPFLLAEQAVPEAGAVPWPTSLGPSGL